MAELPVLRRPPPCATVFSGRLSLSGTHPWSFFVSSRPLLRRLVLCPCTRRSGEAWGSNAETVRRGKFKFSDLKGNNRKMDDVPDDEGESWSAAKRKWWSDDEDDDFSDDEMVQSWDNIWIFKVFKAYGYLLPAIIASMLLASGPKAFLMALAFPLAQSALSFAVDKLSGRTSSGGERRRRQNSPPSPPRRKAGGSAKFRRRAEEKPTAGVGRNYGGWDEVYPRPAPPPPLARKGKLSRRERGGEVPLLLRLIISIFPFLGSWTRIL